MGLRLLVALAVAAAVLLGLALSTPVPALAAGPFTVNTTNDTHDATPGDGVCADSNGQCSLRAAIEEANADGGTTTINVPNGTYNLSLGELKTGSASGTNITINGTGTTANTIIGYASQGTTRVFNIDYSFLGGVTVTIQNVTIQNGVGNVGGGGGAILDGDTGDILNLTNDVFNNNTTSAFNGGAISFTGGGTLKISNTTFTNNTSPTGNGGAIHFLQTQPGGFSIDHSIFTNNTASGGALGGQGGAINVGCNICSPFSITHSTFTGNSAIPNGASGGQGGAIMFGSGTATIQYNRIVGNTAAGGGSGIYDAGGTADATDNWWGCNGGPGATGCDTAVQGSGTLTTSPHIVLTITASPTTITTSSGPGPYSSTLTASFLTDSGGSTISAGNLGALVGVPVTWGSPSLSGATLSGQQTTVQSSGTATATYTPGTVGGPDSVSAKVDNATVSASLTVDEPASITSANHTTFTVGTAGSFTVMTTGYPTPSVTETGSLPSGVTLHDNGNGTATLGGTAAVGTGAVYTVTITAHNGIGSDATQTFTLTVDEPASVASANNATFTVGTAGSFTVTTRGYPKPTLSETGSLPSGVTFVDNLDGTATLSGTPAAGTGGVYTLTITAHNGVGSDGTQSFTLTVDEPASITSANSTTFTVGTAGSFTVTTTGFPKPSLTEMGALPTGVTLTDNGDGTATLAGTPTSGTGGTYTLAITAHNGVGSDATQTFTLTVDEAASITSADHTTFTVGSAGSFTVTTGGFPVPSLSETGALPTGVTFVDNANGTATLSGTPAAGTGGIYTLTLTAHNGIGTDATQTFTLIVDFPPSITSADHTTFTVGSAGSFTVMTTGLPAPLLSETGSLPSGVTFTDNGDGTATLAGTPAAGTGGVYTLTITAHNGIGSDATQTFTLNVVQAAAITSADHTTFTVGSAGSFTVTATGVPTPSLTETGSLPSGVTFHDNGDGTATLAGTPTAGAGGVYTLTITAHNGIGSDATQTFTLTVDEAASITSADHTTFTIGSAGSFTVTTGGFPVPSLTETGSLPSGVTFTNNGNGTATLSGTPAVGTNGSYTLTLTAHNGIGADGTQTFTLKVAAATTTTTPTNATAQDVATSVTLTATVTSPAGTVNEGTVAFTVTDVTNTPVGTAVSGNVSNGSVMASFNPHGLAPGSYTITASYSDTGGTFLPSSGTATLTITPGPPASLTLSPGNTSVTIGTSATETATVEDGAGYPVADGTTVNFSVTGITMTSGSATTTNGQASFSYGSVLPGKDTFTATAEGGTNPFVTATITWTLPASTPRARLTLINPVSPPFIVGDVATDSTGAAYGVLLWISPQLTFLRVQPTALVVSGPTATLWGNATLINGQVIEVRIDAVSGRGGTVRLRTSTGYDSGTIHILRVGVLS